MSFGIIFGILLILFIFVGNFIRIKNYELYIYSFDFVVSIFVFFIHIRPGVYFDMLLFSQTLENIRYYNIGDIMSGLNWALNSSPYTSVPFDAFYIWMFSLFKSNGWLFAVTTLVFLIILSKFIIYICKENHYNYKVAIYVEVIVLSIFCLGWEISGLRNYLSFLIFVVAIYSEIKIPTIKGKLPYFLAYIISYLIHPAVLIFIVLRLLLLIKSKILYFVIIIFALVYTTFVNSILNSLEKLKILPIITQKSNFYLYGAQSFDSFENTYVIHAVELIFITLILEFILFKALNVKNERLNQYLKFYIVCTVFALGSILSTQVFLRSVMLILFMSIPIKAALFSNVRLSLLKHNCSGFTTSNAVLLYRFLTISFSLVMFVFWYFAIYKDMLI